jgi:hypothetical protein
VPKAAAADPVYNEAAARIVAEEREAKGKLPNYPGLEKYNLVVKMGEYAQCLFLMYTNVKWRIL